MSTYGTISPINYDKSRNQCNFSGFPSCCEYQKREDDGKCTAPLSLLLLINVSSILWPSLSLQHKYGKDDGYMIGYPLMLIAFTICNAVFTYFSFTTKCNQSFFNGGFEKYNPTDYMCCHMISLISIIASIAINIIWIASIVLQTSHSGQNNTNI